MKTPAESKHRLDLLAGIRPDLATLIEHAAKNDQAEGLIARWAGTEPERWKRWERLGRRMLGIQATLDRLQDAQRLDAEVLRQIIEQVVAVQTIWRVYDEERAREVAAFDPEEEEDREAMMASAEVEAAEHDAAIAAILGTLRELLLQVEG